MEWSKEADTALRRVPFFVRKRVRTRVEQEARRSGAQRVDLSHVETCRQRFLHRMEDEVKGYRVETCFGPGGCPNRAVEGQGPARCIEEILEKERLKDFLKGRVAGPLKMHHEFQVSISDCPNACSRPQIADLGLVGVREPKITEAACEGCGACTEVCKEDALRLEGSGVCLDREKCLACGQCIGACPTGTLAEEAQGYRLLVGGKLGRHPRLATPVNGVMDEEEALSLVKRILAFYKDHCRGGERLGEILRQEGLTGLEANLGVFEKSFPEKNDAT